MTAEDPIVAFLRACYDEEEQTARAAGGALWTADEIPGCIHVEARAIAQNYHLRKLGYVGKVEHECDRRHMVRHDPARVLREVEAKRELLDLAVYFLGWNADHDQGVTEHEIQSMRRAGQEILRRLAQPYSDRPEYAALVEQATT